MNCYIVEGIVCVIVTAVFMVKFIKHNPKLFGVLDSVITKAADYGLEITKKVQS